MSHPLFVEVKLKMGKIIYFNKYTGFVDNTKPVVHNLRTGGILADEDGLGKTVEVLACILLSPKPTVLKTLVADFNSGTKKRKRKTLETTSCNGHKKIKLSSDVENSLIDDVSTSFKKQLINKEEVNCICGSNKMTQDAVQCVDCLKYRHGSCVNYKRELGDYRCPNCWLKQPLIESKATLIVCPSWLRAQWCDELTKHVTHGLQSFVYKGSKITSVYPTELADFDIVITTYTVLQLEFRLSQNTKIPSLRHIRRYGAQGSPLSCIKWWRLCLDEAHVIESSNTQIATMAKTLKAQHRWAITSTPITRNVSGLFGILEYLQLEPFNEYETWKHLLYLPYKQGKTQPLFDFLAQIMWRTSKEEAIDQMHLPTLAEKEYLLEFSAVENFFYRREHNLSAIEFKSNLTSTSISDDVQLESLDKGALNVLMGPLVNIRQACNYANTVGGRYLVTPKQVTSVQDLLDVLITKNLNSCEENLGGVICALNDLAGFSLLLNNPKNSATAYRKVLVLANHFKLENSQIELNVDLLQLIHAVHNLADVLETWISIKPLSQEYTLRKDCLELQEKYMEKFTNQCVNAFEESESATQTIAKIKEQFTLAPKKWYSKIIDWITVHNLLDELTSNLYSEVNNVNTLRFKDEQHLYYFISTWEDEISIQRLKANAILSQMYHFENGVLKINHDLFEAATPCHLLLQTTKRIADNQCLLCNFSRGMDLYQSKLFEITPNVSEENRNVADVDSFKPTWTEIVLRALLALAKSKCLDKEAIHNGELYITMLDALKNEYMLKRTFCSNLHQQINALNSVDLCKQKVCLKTSGGTNQDNKIHVLNNRKTLIGHVGLNENPARHITALLLPLYLCSKGLNLVEASQIIFVEPLLNPTDKFQTISRAYRMGQTKPITVHAFIVKDTIEENIHKATASNVKVWSSKKLTVGQLSELFNINELGSPL